MLRSLDSLIHYKLSASDGDIGKVSDFYFDDERWVIRYLVADCGGFFSHRQVLISPIAFEHRDFSKKRFHVALTRENVRNSPSVDLAEPVSRRYEREFLRYYGWPYYWGYGGTGLWGAYDYPQMEPPDADDLVHDSEEEIDDPHLRGLEEVIGYHVQCRDGELGHIQDLVWDDTTWAIRYLVVATSNWWIGRRVLVSPHWLTEMSWADKKAKIELPREVIRFSPEWNPKAAIHREYEEALHRYYERPAYWVEEERRRAEKPPASTAEVLSEHR